MATYPTSGGDNAEGLIRGQREDNGEFSADFAALVLVKCRVKTSAAVFYYIPAYVT